MIRRLSALVSLLGTLAVVSACEGTDSGGASGGTAAGGGGGGAGGPSTVDSGAGGQTGGHVSHDAAIPVDVTTPPPADASTPPVDASNPPGDGPGPLPDDAATPPPTDATPPPADCGACRDTHCDDGTDPLCPMPEPECPDGQLAAVRGNCWACVDALTCAAATSCVTDADCVPDMYCDPCAHGSCPACDDCVAECVSHACQSENQPACDMNRPTCDPGQVAVVRDGCWLCVSLDTCEPPAPPGECAALGGYCEDWQVQCQFGFTGQPPLDCPHGRSDQCCVPDAPNNCIPEGESGAVVPGVPPCCPGLTNVGCQQPVNGVCEMCVGAFFCVRPDDGVCGQAENVCNSPADCARAPQ